MNIKLYLVLFALLFGAQLNAQDILEALKAEKDNLGISTVELSEAYVKDQYISSHNNVEHFYIQQRHKGIDVYNGLLTVARRNGEILVVNKRSLAVKINYLPSSTYLCKY